MPHRESFQLSAVDGRQLGAIMREYVARERARVYRRLFVTRFGFLALLLAVLGAGFNWLSPFASWFSVALCLAAPLAAWIAERRCDRRLSRYLNRLPPPVLTSESIRKS
jgi:hypothetical protein